MKKTLVLILFGAIIVACSTPKTVISSKRVIKGYWNLDKISYNQKGTFNVSLFNDTSKECFEGSTWRFIPNNNSGIYTIQNGDCPTGDRNFIFSVKEMDAASGLYDFLLKPTVKQGRSNKNETQGFRVNLTALSDTNMQWVQTVDLDGTPFNINMDFSKIEE
ncbi:MAG: hypothetical protein ACI849_000422 [Patiriisocius sp.]|jgi:hypothetical protein